MTPRIAFAAAALALATGCPRPQPPPPLPAPPDESQALLPEVRGLARDAEALLRDQDERIWKAWTEGSEAELARSYQGREVLFSAANIRKIDRLRQLSSEAQEVRALTHLLVYFVGERLSAELADLNEAQANLEAALTFTASGKEHRYRELERLLANEPGAAERRALYDGATAAVQRLTPILRRREERIRAVLQQLGYPSYEAFGAELRQVDLDRLGLLADEILQLTRPAYLQVMDELSRRELSIPFSEVRRPDLPRLFRPKGVDAFFPAEAILPRAQETLSGAGIPPSSIPGFRIDSAPRPRKNPRPLTVAPIVPGDVRLSFLPRPGLQVQASLLHELGHALHLAFTREKRFELAKLGAGAQSEAFGDVFEDLIEDPVWLEEKAGLSGERLSAYLWATGAHKLFLVRSAAGHLLYQLELRRRGGEDAKAVYKAIMERTFELPLADGDAERYLADTEDFFQSADEFRGWFLAAQIQAQLKARFGPRWWGSGAAGTFLQSLWAFGTALNARELAVRMGDEGVRPDVLLLRLATTLKVPMKLGAKLAREPDPQPAHLPGASDGGVPPARSPDAGSP